MLFGCDSHPGRVDDVADVLEGCDRELRQRHCGLLHAVEAAATEAAVGTRGACGETASETMLKSVFFIKVSAVCLVLLLLLLPMPVLRRCWRCCRAFSWCIIDQYAP